jgi:hypothetical protein
MKNIAIAIAILLPCCTVYRHPSGEMFVQAGGKVHFAAATFEGAADNTESFKDMTRMVYGLGVATIVAGVAKDAAAKTAETDKAAIAAGTESETIAAGAEKARLAQEVDLRKLELEMMEVVP